MEAFNALPPNDMDARFLRWAELKTLLPEDAQVEQHLRSTNVVRADAFTLDLNDQGDFTPLLLNRYQQHSTTDEFIATSARLTALLQTLDSIHASGEKALIFLENLELQGLLAPYLQQRYQLAQLPKRINGSVAGHRRKSYVDAFQQQTTDGFDVMLLSPRAGGVGLTLTAANHVIHLSRWWNPAVEDQCTDRVFRIGQNRPVQVYYPLAIHRDFEEHSFDLNLHRLLERKRNLNQDLLAPTITQDNDIRELFQQTAQPPYAPPPSQNP